MNNYVYAGIDYSINSPAICIYDKKDGIFCFDNCTFFCFAQTTHHESLDFENIHIEKKLPDFLDDIDKFVYLSEWVLDKLIQWNYKTKICYIEDYAYSATGRIFNIAENVGFLKRTLWDNKIQYKTIPPAVIKKEASGKGNANKDLMYESFCKENNINLNNYFNINTSKIINPVSDIIDAYYICKLSINEV